MSEKINGWTQYEQHVLHELTRLAERNEAHAECMTEVKTHLAALTEHAASKEDVAALKAVSRIWGAASGLLAGGVVSLVVAILAKMVMS